MLEGHESAFSELDRLRDRPIVTCAELDRIRERLSIRWEASDDLDVCVDRSQLCSRAIASVASLRVEAGGDQLRRDVFDELSRRLIESLTVICSSPAQPKKK